MAHKVAKPLYINGDSLNASAYTGPWMNTLGLSILGMTAKWTAAAPRSIARHSGDAVVAGTKTVTLANGAFTAADKGGTLTVAGTTGGTNDGAYTITTVTNATTIVTSQAWGGGDESFGVGVTFSLQQANPKGTFGFQVSDDGESPGSIPVAPTLKTGNPAYTITMTGPNTDASTSKCEITDFPHHWGRLIYTPDGTNPGGGLLYVAFTGKGF